ncbi:hypothetical protein ACFUMJ_18485 [Streptomyces olivaceus]|uniref:hypothetical protein n=1 Tax=Streptomyces TaxID=1883 RepID=UPI001FB60EB6|nr:hypothetical protein [Streptomyces sp. CB09030]UOG83822.1 hypothetical protein L6J92_33715 [Streptomyces sp. CB09030]
MIFEVRVKKLAKAMGPIASVAAYPLSGIRRLIDESTWTMPGGWCAVTCRPGWTVRVGAPERLKETILKTVVTGGATVQS